MKCFVAWNKMGITLVSGIIVWTCDMSNFRQECDKSEGVTYYKDMLGHYYALCKKHKHEANDIVTEDEILCYLISKM